MSSSQIHGNEGRKQENEIPPPKMKRAYHRALTTTEVRVLQAFLQPKPRAGQQQEIHIVAKHLGETNAEGWVVQIVE